MRDKLSFEVQKFSIMDDISDEQFAFVEVYVCHDGNNAHNMPISFEALNRAKDTLKNKFLVAGYNGRDFKGHEKDIHINGLYLEPTPVLNFSIEGIIGEAVTLKLAEKEIFISNGLGNKKTSLRFNNRPSINFIRLKSTEQK